MGLRLKPGRCHIPLAIIVGPRIYSWQNLRWWEENGFFFPEADGKILCLRELSLSPWARSRSDKRFKVAGTVCHHKNPENEANKVLRVVKKPSLFNLIWTPGPSCAWSQDFSITRMKTSLFWIKCFWVRYSITCYWKGPHWYKVK